MFTKEEFAQVFGYKSLDNILDVQTSPNQLNIIFATEEMAEKFIVFVVTEPGAFGDKLAAVTLEQDNASITINNPEHIITFENYVADKIAIINESKKFDKDISILSPLLRSNDVSAKGFRKIITPGGECVPHKLPFIEMTFWGNEATTYNSELNVRQGLRKLPGLENTSITTYPEDDLAARTDPDHFRPRICVPFDTIQILTEQQQIKSGAALAADVLKSPVSSIPSEMGELVASFLSIHENNRVTTLNHAANAAAKSALKETKSNDNIPDRKWQTQIEQEKTTERKM